MIITSRKPGFNTCDAKGFQITFANLVMVSVQFGPGNYCDNYDADFNDLKTKRSWSSSDAEIAVIGPNGWLTKAAHRDLTGEDPGDDVLARLKPEDVFRYIEWAIKYDPSIRAPEFTCIGEGI